MREPADARPGAPHHFEGFFEPGVSLVRGDAEPGELGVPVALADAQIQPTAGHEVVGRCLLGEQDGVVPGKGDHAGAQTQRGRAHRQTGQHRQRR
jgi:hypothetical protein